ncbi:chlorite dismutase family protein [Virgibacillus halophilus]|uniref:Coproheme decarboxylase n=1 Tax=Tigheibacillus halophilus TaxID=361280 RepID=A0ABU5CCS9_9BACI|nr:chlorite dismutase family protein [Virgibacillus halophilus]
MSKLRGEINNWFTLEKNDRGRMMFDHIKTAKPFTEKVKRIITGAIGLDDYEWGVSLFCNDPLQFKKLIYDTRFDEVSAKYGIFGSFLHRPSASSREDQFLFLIKFRGYSYPLNFKVLPSIFRQFYYLRVI